VENEQRDGECEAQRAYDNVCYAEEVVLQKAMSDNGEPSQRIESAE
jgi:hypothetical protein